MIHLSVSPGSSGPLLVLATGVSLVLAVSAGAMRQEPAAPAPAASGPVAFQVAHGLVFVEVVGPDGPLLALLDTGANASAIDDDRAAGLPVQGVTEVLGTTGSFEVENVELEGLSLGDLALPDLIATRRDLGGLLAPGDATVDLILGSDALVGRALTIDFEARELELSASVPDEAAGVAMELDQGIPTLPAVLAGLETTLRIDTGASLFATSDVYVNVPTRLWDELRAGDQELEPTRWLQGTGAGGATVDLPVVRLRDVRIGPETLAAVFLIVQPEAGYFARSDAKGFVGNNFLEKLRSVTLDYGARRFRVTEAPR